MNKFFSERIDSDSDDFVSDLKKTKKVKVSNVDFHYRCFDFSDGDDDQEMYEAVSDDDVSILYTIVYIKNCSFLSDYYYVMKWSIVRRKLEKKVKFFDKYHFRISTTTCEVVRSGV